MKIADLPPARPRPAEAPLALEGIRVVDFTHFIAGPLATQMLADLGADVIKIENAVGGDSMRAMRPPEIGGEGSAFLSANRNKRSVALDLGSAAGRAIARDLAARADVVAENFSSGVMEKFGLDYASLSKTNPRVVYCSVSAYGRSGEHAHRAGFDPVLQAASGFMSLNGFPDRSGVRTGAPVIDIATSLVAGNAILAALVGRARHGHGQHVEATLFDTAIAMVGFAAMNCLVSGRNPSRTGNASVNAVPVGVWEARDGAFYLACANDRTYHRLVRDVLGRPDLVADPRFVDNAGRVANSEALSEILASAFAPATRDALMLRLEAAGVPAGPVRTVAEALASPEVVARGLLSRVPHPTAGEIPDIAPPVRLNAMPRRDTAAAPTLGQHTDEVLRDLLGFDERAFATARAQGAFGAAA